MSELLPRLQNGLRRRWLHAQSDRQTERLGREIEQHAPADRYAPVVFFNASTRLEGMSLNAGFALTSAWALRLQGVPVVHFVCHAGMTRNMLAAALNGAEAAPPCRECIAKSKKIYVHANVRWFEFTLEQELAKQVESLTVDQLAEVEYRGMPLGKLALPALRWALRLYHVPDTESSRYLYRQFILSAWNVAREFSQLLDEVKPQAVVLFNGVAFPEAAARWVAQQRRIPVITHEVGLYPYTAFFTRGDATAYPIEMPADFELSAPRAARLDAYLEKRFQGKFSMAGVQFWPEMRSLSPDLLEKMSKFRQVVPVFTNVIFDTSQEHANVLFEHMFAWLDQVLEIADAHPDTLFVLRAHPDESRPGKASRESVAEWAARNHITERPNVLFVPSNEYLSSYELIQRSKFVMVYNSTIGLEAAILGAAVLSAGRSRYTQVPTVFFPASAEEHRQKANQLLEESSAGAPPEFQQNARKFLYYQLFCASLPFETVLEEDGVWRGFVRLKDIPWQSFLPENSPTFRTIVSGILHEEPFVLPE